MNTFTIAPSARMLRLGALAALLASAVFVSGCANRSASSQVYTYGQAQQEQTVRYGTVVSVRAVTIQAESTSGAGTIAGAAVGGVAGSAIGGGRGQILTSIGGAIIGGIVGNAVENQVNKSSGLEITVRLDSGDTRVIVQEDDVQLASGQRVQVISGARATRVVPM